MYPTSVGPYVLADRIGTGSGATVWRAWDRRRRRWVAGKLVTAYDEATLLRLHREQARRIEHPHLATPTGWAVGDAAALVAADLVRGGTLDRLLAEHGSLPASYAAVLLDQLLAGLEAVHAAGLVHRDVTPANLLLEPTRDRRPHLRLGDFGVACPTGSVPRDVVGTAGYVAPEHPAGARPDPRQDLYAAGVVGVEMVTGRPPLRRRRAPPGALRPLLEALTESDPGRRPASASLARATLRASALPGGTPWRKSERSPDVPDRLGRPRVPGLLTPLLTPGPAPGSRSR